MIKHSLKAEVRTQLGRKAKTLRTQGLIPASIFGKDISSQNLSLNAKDFAKIYAQVGESGLVYLQVADSKTETSVICSEVVIHPVTDQILHVSLRHVSLTEKINAPVKLELSGKSPAVTDGLGVLVQQIDEIEIEALPQDFPENITVDISTLTAVGASIVAKDLKLSSKLKVVVDPETIIVKIEPLAKEEVVAPPPATEAPVGETPVLESSPGSETPPTTSEKK